MCVLTAALRQKRPKKNFVGKLGCLAAISNSLAMERRGGRDGGGRFAAYEGRQISRKTGNLRAVQLLLGHTKFESTVQYLVIEIDDVLMMAEQIDL